MMLLFHVDDLYPQGGRNITNLRKNLKHYALVQNHDNTNRTLNLHEYSTFLAISLWRHTRISPSMVIVCWSITCSDVRTACLVDVICSSSSWPAVTSSAPHLRGDCIILQSGIAILLYLKTHGSTILNDQVRLVTRLFTWRHCEGCKAGRLSSQRRCIRAPCSRRRQQTLSAPGITHNRVHDCRMTSVRTADDVPSKSHRRRQHRRISVATRSFIDVTLLADLLLLHVIMPVAFGIPVPASCDNHWRGGL